MSRYVEIAFTETNLMSKEQFLLRGGISVDIEGRQSLMINENDFGAAPPAEELDFSDLPDFGHPLPEVTLREQIRLTSVRRGQVLSCQRGHQQRFLEIWHSYSSGN